MYMRRVFERLKISTKETQIAIVTLVVLFAVFFTILVNAGTLWPEFITNYRLDVPQGTPIIERVSEAIDDFEDVVNDGFPARWEFIEYYGLAQKAMNKKIMPDPNYGRLYKTNAGQITYAVKAKSVNLAVRKTIVLADELEAMQIPFLYVQAPFKQPSNNAEGFVPLQELPINTNDYANKNADTFLEGLQGEGINTYDMRPEFWQSGMSQNQLFFNTDHHWTIQGAFYGTGLLEKHLNENYGFSIDEKYRNVENYDFKTFKDFYIGSMGRRVGKLYGGLDDFTLITPKFATDYTLLEREGISEVAFEGNFEDAILNKTFLDTKADLTTNRYAAYHGDNSELVFENHLQDKGRILLIKDSFGIPVYSFLSLGVKEVRAIDVRLFEKDLTEYIKEVNPDLVIMMYNADSFGREMFIFDNS